MLICSVNMTDTKRLRERTNVLSFFINILILERGSGMKSYSKFIIEKKKGTAVASPAPGDPLDPKGRKKIDKKFSNPANPPKVANPEAPKPAPKPEAIKQSDVSKQAANYRRAERVKGATGGKTTGSLSKGNLSFPGDRSGATAKAKSDIEARKGFSGSKSGGLKADEANPNVNRSVRQQRTVKQGIPDPFKSKTPAPADPFKGVTSAKPVKPSMPDPFKGTESVPQKPKKSGAPERPALRQAISDIKKSRSKLGITKSFTPKPSTPKPPKTVPQTDANKYIRTMQDQGRPVDPDFVGAQGPKASGAKPEMVGGSTAPTGTGTRMRAKGDAIRDISKTKNADLDKALNNLVNSGDVKKSKPSGPSSSIGFRQFSRKATQLQKSLKAPATPKPSAASKAPVTPKGVTGGLTAPKGGVKTSPGVGPKSYTKSERILQDMQRKMAQSGVDPKSGRRLSNPERKRAMQVAKNPRAVELAKPPKPTSGGGALAKLGSSTRGTTGSSAVFGKRLGGTNQLMSRSKDKVTFRQPSRAGTPEKVSNALASVRKGSQTLQGGASQVAQASRSKDVMKGMMKQAGGVGGRVLGAAGSALDAYSSYKTYRKAGDDRLRAGLKSAFRTSVGWLGGAAGSALGSVAGPVGTVGGGIAGYGAGVGLADKVLSRLRKPSQRKKK